MVYKYFVFMGKSSYEKAIFADYYKNAKVYLFSEPDNFIKRLLFTIHFSYKINKFLNLPFKDSWLNKVMPKSEMISNERKIFIFHESSPLAYCEPLLRKIKKSFLKSVLCYKFSNPPNDKNLLRLSVVKNLYNYVITFNDFFVKENWIVYDTGIYTRNEIPKNDVPRSDLFFIGKNKGRLFLLLQIYDKMLEFGLKCDFYITDVKNSDVVLKRGIVYNKNLDYFDVLKHIEKTTCILEVLEGNFSYQSIRTFEALAYGKRLITTSSGIEKSPHYLSDNMHSIVNASEIKKEWFALPIEPYSINLHAISPNRFLEFIENKADHDNL